MSTFSLRSQSNGQVRDFSILEVLHLLGDTVNDEIAFNQGKDIYNLSSFRETGGSNGTATDSAVRWARENAFTTIGQSAFVLRYLPQPPLLLVVLNGMLQQPGSDYTIDGKQLQLPFSLQAQDSLQVIYTY